MTKYDLNFKLNAINFFMNNDVSLAETCKKFNIKSHANLTYWINAYKNNGIKGLRHRSNKEYDLKFKTSVVNYYKTHEISTANLAIKYDINPTQVYLWIKTFDLYGIAGLEISRKVGRPPLKKNKKNDKVVPLTDSERNKYINEIMHLKSKLYKSEMENDIIKKQIALEMKMDIFPKHDN